MKQSFLSITVLLAVIFAFSCNTPVAPNAANANSAKTAAVVTQKVILLYGNYALVNKDATVQLVDGNKNILQLPVSSLINGKALFGDNKTNKFQGPLLFKDDGTTYKLISDFLKLSGSGYSADKLTLDGTQGIVIPRNPPGCGVGGCPGMPSFQMLTMEVNIAVPITTEATTR